ncbi:MAG: CHASE domain-containing protein [Massilia sp.]
MRTQGYLAFVTGICLTIWTCLLVTGAQQATIRNDFLRDTEKVASDTNVRLQIYFDMLLSIKGTFAVNHQVDREQFARFVRELNLTQRYPGFQAIQFVRKVPGQDLEAFSAKVRSDTSVAPGGYPNFKVHPPYDGPEHYIVEYTEPMVGNENAFGLDLAALPPHRAALELGRDSGRIVATERIILVQDASGQPGFVARAPIYAIGMPLATVDQRRAALVGWVAIVFRVNNLMQEVIEPALLNQLSFRIHDAGNVSEGASTEPNKNNVMYDSAASTAGRPSIPGLAVEKRLNVAQRQWIVRFTALEGSRYSRDLGSVLWIAAGGTLISALIGALLIASRRSRILAAKVRVTLDEQRAFQDSASVGIALFAGGVIVRCNRGMEEMMGYAPGTLAGQRISVLTAGAPAGEDVFTVDSANRRWQGERELVRHDGSVIWCLINGKALKANDLAQGGVWVIQDISARKHTEAALVDAKHGLEHSLNELAQQKANVESAHSDLSSVLATLKQAQTNLITSEKMASLGSLVAGIAHELNTPIGNSLLTATALEDMVRAFEKQYADGGIKRSVLEAHLVDTRTACNIMTSSLRRAADLITSFKQVAVDQTSDKRRRFDLNEVLHDTLATFAAQLKRTNCETRIDCPPALILDSYPGSVGQVVSNLINNALLHAFEGRSSGLLSITARATGDEQMLLIFSDDGVGMPPKILHQVFDPFFTTKMGQGGSGLGMNIVYNIVTGMLGGSITIESSLEHGTTVTMRVPRVAPNRETEDAEINLLLT